ncbi:MCE family protein [Rhodococcus erythropolis]|uniref:MCE family protein n=1 Tax=Rhodococcus erythropolis TaxID=1833 RepID=UPI001E33A049|nr:MULTISPECIES: MCE family protein [Rhodococcus erythropolis group]MCD2107131.1 MCE family protein [Rhodococcus qingshengii]MCZ4526560.1 MCE family protein [Rhodococcus erythropolis]
MNVRGPAIKLLVFVIVTSTITFLLATVVGNIRFGPQNSYAAVFTNSSGIKVGDDVKVAGVPVGKVKKVELRSAEEVLVSFAVNTDRPIMSGTTAKIRYKNLIADRYLQLEEGPGASVPIKPGSIIPVTQTRGSLDMDKLLNGFRPLLQGLDPDQTNKLTASLIQVVGGESNNIAQLVRDIGTLSVTLADKDEVIGRVVDNLGAVTTTLDERSDDLSNMVLDLQRLVSGLSDDRGTITNAVDSLDGATATISAVLADARAPLAEDIDQLGLLAANLNSRTTELDLLLGGLPNAYQKISRVSSYGNFVNLFVCGLAIRYPGIGGGAETPMYIAPADRCH